MGVIKGGAALNIVPQHCQFDFEFAIYRMSLDDTLASLQAYAEGELLPKCATAADRPLPSTAQPVSRPVERPHRRSPAGCQWAECEDFQRSLWHRRRIVDEAGVATLVCGPEHEQGHKADELLARRSWKSARRC